MTYVNDDRIVAHLDALDALAELAAFPPSGCADYADPLHVWQAVQTATGRPAEFADYMEYLSAAATADIDAAARGGHE